MEIDTIFDRFVLRVTPVRRDEDLVGPFESRSEADECADEFRAMGAKVSVEKLKNPEEYEP